MFSSPIAFMEMASDGAPIVDTLQFDDMMDTYGWNMRKRTLGTTKDCPCFDPQTKIADPGCADCQGTGSVGGYVDEIIKGILLFNAPNGQWSLGNVHTTGGSFERVEAAGFFPSWVDVGISDLILLVISQPTDPDVLYQEFEVINLIPSLIGDRSGNYNHIYTRADMRRTTYPHSGAFPP